MNLPLKVSYIDRLGAGVSFACSIHCAIVPFAATVLPLLGFGCLWLTNASSALFFSLLSFWLPRAFAGESAFTVGAVS
jgi:hypothetical protein